MFVRSLFVLQDKFNFPIRVFGYVMLSVIDTRMMLDGQSIDLSMNFIECFEQLLHFQQLVVLIVKIASHVHLRPYFYIYSFINSNYLC